MLCTWERRPSWASSTHGTKDPAQTTLKTFLVPLFFHNRMLKSNEKPTADKPIHCLWLQAKDGLVNANPDFKKLRLGSKFQTCQVDCHQDEAHACDIHTVSGQLGLSVGNQKSSKLLLYVGWYLHEKEQFSKQTRLCRIVELPKVDHGRIAARCQRLSARHTHCCHHLCAHQWTAMFLTPPRSKKVCLLWAKKLFCFDVWVQNYFKDKSAKNMKVVEQQEATWSGECWQWAIVCAYTSTLHVRVWILGKVLKQVDWWMKTSHCLAFGAVSNLLAFYLTHRGEQIFRKSKSAYIYNLLPRHKDHAIPKMTLI